MADELRERLAKAIHANEKKLSTSWDDTCEIWKEGFREDADAILPIVRAAEAACLRRAAAMIQANRIARGTQNTIWEQGYIEGQKWSEDEIAALISEPAGRSLDELLEKARAEFSKECEKFHEEGRKCITCGRMSLEALDAALAQAVKDEHANHSEFASDLYSVMIDPCAEGEIKEEEMFAALLEAAREQREQLHNFPAALAQARLEEAEWWAKRVGFHNLADGTEQARRLGALREAQVRKVRK